MRFLLTGTLALTLALAGCQPTGQSDTTPDPPPSSPQSTEQVDPSPGNVTSQALPEGVEPGSNAAIAWEALMGPDGEYAAAAHYQAVLDTFGDVEPYMTIKAAEERHIDALVRQLSRFGIDAPQNPYMGSLQAPDDLETAAREWAAGEVANVEMYDELIDQATDNRLIRVLENLRRASLEQHLPAFEAAAANGGTLYADQMGGLGGGN